MGTIKQQRVAEQMKVFLSEFIRLEMSDPRVGAVTVTEVKIDRELQHADVFINALGDETRQDEVMAGLSSAQSFIRRELARRVRLRKVPQLHFHWDASLQNALAMDALLDSLEIPPEMMDGSGEVNRAD